MVKRKRTLGVDRAPDSGQRPANPSDSTVRTIPLVFPENESNGALPETSYGSDNDQRDDREVCPNDDTADCKEEKSNRLSHDVLSDESWYIQFLDKKICIKCNESGEVLVCNENGCPVVIHAKCLCCEPEFDDRGNFYCPYCWFKQAVAEVQELRRKAVKAKEALSSFLDKTVTTGNRLSKKESVAGDESCLYVCNRHDDDGVNNQTFQVHAEEKRETDITAATADPNRIAVEGEAHVNPSVVNTIDSRHYGGQKTPVPFEPVPDSRNKEKLDPHNISETHETRFLEGGEKIETEVLRDNDEDIQRTIGKDVLKALPLSVYHSGEYADGQALDIAFAKGTQESDAISAENKDRMNYGEKALPEELKVSATASSVSETNDSDSEALSLQKKSFKRRASKTLYSEKVDSVWKTPSQKSNSRGKNALIQNEDATNCKILGQSQGSSKKVKDLHFLNSRKRLRWTAEEENMLKKGVEMFAKENQNTPWRKILEYGCNVFDSTRSPVDLKDKWRNIVAKEGWK